MNPLLRVLARSLTPALVACTAFAADPASDLPLKIEPKNSTWIFSLLPKSLQKRPTLDFHVITEMTDEGRKLTPPSSRNPTYYIEQPGKFAQMGNNTPAGEEPPVVPRLERAIQQALAVNGYLPATPQSPIPKIAVIMNYGSFARFSTDAADMQQAVAMENFYRALAESDPSIAVPVFTPYGDDRPAISLLPMVLANRDDRADVIKRADLIGGSKFAKSLAEAIDQQAIYTQARAGMYNSLDDISSPFRQFVNANADIMNLVEESFSSCYFVVASAYDYREMKKGKRVLLWRTKMTVNSSGISMNESMSSLITSAAPYFGKDMSASVTLTRRISREGRVDVGTPVEVDDRGVPVNAPRKPANTTN